MFFIADSLWNLNISNNKIIFYSKLVIKKKQALCYLLYNSVKFHFFKNNSVKLFQLNIKVICLSKILETDLSNKQTSK